jgi:hypothetical protein
MGGCRALINVKIISGLHVLILVEVVEVPIVPLLHFVVTGPLVRAIPDGAPELKSVLRLSVLPEDVRIRVPGQEMGIV